MLSEIQLGKKQCPWWFKICVYTLIWWKKKWGGAQNKETESAHFLFLPVEFICTISVFLYFSSATSAYFFHIEKEDKLSSFFYIKRTQAYRKKLAPAFSSPLTHVLIKTLSVTLSLRVIGISSFNRRCLFCYAMDGFWNQGIHEGSLISESAALCTSWIKAYIWL